MIITKTQDSETIGRVETEENQIVSLWVHEDHRRQGIARDLLWQAIRNIEDEGHEKAVVVAAHDTSIGIEALCDFYEDAGFTAIDCASSNPIMEMRL